MTAMGGAGTSFSHVGTFAHDLVPIEDFYTRVLEFAVTDRGEYPERTIIFLSRGPDAHHETVLVSGRPVELGFIVINQISLRCGSPSIATAFHQPMLREPAASSVSRVTHGNALTV
jgi:hypothetical protein